MPTVGSIVVDLVANTSKFIRGIDESTTEMEKFGRVMEATGTKMRNIGRSLFTRVTLPITALGVASVKLASDFETSMTKIETLVGIAGDEVGRMRSQVLELSGQTSKSPRELADALFVVTSAGLRGSKAMETLQQSAKASVAGLGETQDIARAVTGVLQAYSKQGLQASEATDILLGTVRAGNLEASELAPTLGRVVGIAGELGVSFKEVGANIATFTRLGVNSAEAVTGLRAILSSVLSPTEKTEQALATVGLSAEDLRRKIGEQGLQRTLAELLEKFQGNSAALADVFPNVRALSNVLGTASAQGETYAQVLKDMEESTGLVDQAFDRTKQTAGQKFAEAINASKKAFISFGETLLPVITKIVEGITSVVKAIGDMNKFWKIVTITVLAFAAVIPPLLILMGTWLAIIGQITIAYGKGLIPAIWASTKAIIAKTVAIGLAILPVVALTAVIVALGLAFMEAGDNAQTGARMFRESFRNEKNFTALGKATESIAKLKKELEKMPKGTLPAEQKRLELFKEQSKRLNSQRKIFTDLAKEQRATGRGDLAQRSMRIARERTKQLIEQNKKIKEQSQLIKKIAKEERERMAREQRAKSLEKFAEGIAKIQEGLRGGGMSPMEKLADDISKAEENARKLVAGLKGLTAEQKSTLTEQAIADIKKLGAERKRQIKKDAEIELAQALLTGKELQIFNEKRRFNALRKQAGDNKKIQDALKKQLELNIGKILADGEKKKEPSGRTTLTTDALRRGSVEAFRALNVDRDNKELKVQQETANNTEATKKALENIERKLGEQGFQLLVRGN